MSRELKFKERSLAGRSLVVGLVGVSLAMVAAAERDIQRRGAEEVRGGKWLWRLVCLNALGSASYFRWGRLPAQR